VARTPRTPNNRPESEGEPAKGPGRGRSKKRADAPQEPASERITDMDVVDEMRQSFLEYSMSVIVARALPDVRDGLKPVHRRILYTMHKQGLRPNVAHSKCARIVGSTMGSLHPHGDSAIYEALVRLAQPWALRLPLVDGHGNFGSLDDGPAAARYTEARMAAAALMLCEELGEDTVDFKPNYDNTETEPTVLPAGFPNLLVNGGSGIAVGMATNMAPHNLVEVVSGLHAMLADPKITLGEMMKHIPGPDFPSGAMIYDRDGIRDAYTSGRGSIKMRAVTSIEPVSSRRQGIVVTELPYNVGPEKVIAKIKELVGQKKLVGVADVKDLSDRIVGLKLVIEIKSGFDPQAVLAELYRLTPLEESFGVNNVALVNGEPRTLGLLDLCRHYLEHRVEVVRRRTQYRLDKAKARAHIVEGLVIALANIDEVVALLKSSKDLDTARQKLIKAFKLSEIQANHILEMPLRRLTGLEVTKLKDELKELKRTIAELEKLLASEKLLRALVGEELARVADAYGTPRRSRILTKAPAADIAVMPRAAGVAADTQLADDPCLVALSSTGLIGRFAPGTPAGKHAKGDLVMAVVPSSNRSTIGAVTSSGRLVRVPVADLPAADVKNRGGAVSEFVDLSPGERVTGLVSIDGTVITMGTKHGLVKRIESSQLPKTSGAVFGLKDGDSVVGAHSVDAAGADAAEFVFITSDAQLLRSGCDQVRPQGPSAGGMAGVRLSEGSEVVTFDVITFDVVAGEGAKVFTATDTATVKVSDFSDYPAKGRGTGGVRVTTFRKADSRLVAACVTSGEVWGVGRSGESVAVPAQLLRRDAAGTVLETAIAEFAAVRPAL